MISSPTLFLFGQVAIAACVGGILYLTLTFFYQLFQLRKFPGPLSFPVIGSCWDPGFAMMYKHFQNLRVKYGKVFYIFSFHRPILVIADPQVARRILSDHKTFFKGEDYTTTFAFVFGKKGLVTANGEDHRKGRNLLGKYFIRSSVSKFTEQINQIANKSIIELLDPKCVANEKGSDMNMEEFFAILALRCFAKFSCDFDTSTYQGGYAYERKLCHIVSKGSYAMSKMVILQEPYWDIMPHAKIIKQVNAMLSSFFGDIVKTRQERLSASHQASTDAASSDTTADAASSAAKFDDMLQAMLNDHTVTDQERFDHFRTAICAGHDTTAFFLSYCVYLLARNQNVQDKLYAHINEILGDDPNVPITADDTTKLKYLQCVMMETLRLYPVIPNITRVCADDVHIKEEEGVNITIPKNITLMISMISMNKDPTIWENPNEFNPLRFEEKVLQSHDFTSAKDGYFPFAYGTRVCIGNTLAQIESAIILVHLLRKYTFSEVEQGFRPKIRGGISLTTSNGMLIHLTPRK